MQFNELIKSNQALEATLYARNNLIKYISPDPSDKEREQQELIQQALGQLAIPPKDRYLYSSSRYF